MYNLCFNITVYLILNGFWRKKDSEKECSRIQHFSCIKHFVQSCVCVYIHICAYTFLRTCLLIVSDHRNGKYHGLSVFWQKDIFTGICNKPVKPVLYVFLQSGDLKMWFTSKKKVVQMKQYFCTENPSVCSYGSNFQYLQPHFF